MNRETPFCEGKGVGGFTSMVWYGAGMVIAEDRQAEELWGENGNGSGSDKQHMISSNIGII